MDVIETLATAFRALSAEQRANLLWHAEAGTNVCCGEDANKFLDDKGGG